MRTISVLAVAILLPPLLAAAPSHGFGLTRCEAEVQEILNSLNVSNSRIRNVTVMNIYGATGGGGAHIDHVEGWISFNDCRGNLVIRLTNSCQRRDVYTTYECRVPNVKNY